VDSHSRLVQLFKVLLPLAALGLLSTLFLLSDSVDPESTIPFAEGDVIERIRDQQITEPFFSGVTDKGEEIQFTADSVSPGGTYSPAEARNLRALLTLNNGGHINLTSNTGHLSMETEMATFTGNVVITTADGLEVTTDLLSTSIREVAGSAPGEVEGHGPIGEFTAGSMELGPKKVGGPIHVLFTNGVKLLYDPKKSER
jgi:lipopolysaccharide export system protein LptC